MNGFEKTFGKSAGYAFSAPGRTEIGGNHTDHQRGCTLSAAVSLKTRALVSREKGSAVKVFSEGYAPFEVDLSELSAREEEAGSAAALVRGVAAGFSSRGFGMSGLCVYVSSDLLPGGGLSSSAAFEVLFGTVFNTLFADGSLDIKTVAKICRFAENEYFKKPCGLLDQMTSAAGGVCGMDFSDPDDPVIEKISFDFEKAGYILCLTDSGASHAGLTHEYAAVANEMGSVAAFFGKTVLREVPKEAFYGALPEVRKACGDRAALRAIHFFDETVRAEKELDALREKDMKTFLRLVSESGVSSQTLLQNVVPQGSVKRQELAAALALSHELLSGEGACRVHGGGFAGTVQSFVPKDRFESFRRGTEKVFGEGSCIALRISPEGGRRENDLTI